MTFMVTKGAIYRLAVRWANAHLPTRHLTYSQYVRALSHLQAATGNLDRTAAIFGSILHQALNGERDAAWVMDELCFEVDALTVGDRQLVTERAVACQGGGTDAFLDLYIDRRNRCTGWSDKSGC